MDSIGWEYIEDSKDSKILISIQYNISESDKKYTKRVKKGSEQVVVTNLDGTPKKDASLIPDDEFFGTDLFLHLSSKNLIQVSSLNHFQLA